jgi:Glutaredoxin and related proteins
MIKFIFNKFQNKSFLQNLSLYHIKMTTFGTHSKIEKLPENMADLLQDGKVLVLTRQNCPYCDLAKEYLDEKEVPYEYILCDKLGITDQQKEQLAQMTGGKTYPRIFIGKHSVGGFSDLREFDDKGKLDQLLEQEKIPHLKYLQYGVPKTKL